VDITRQALQVISITYYNDLIESYQEKNLPYVKQVGDNLLDLIDDMDLVLMTNEYFLLGRWLNAAKRMAKITGGKRLFEFNARNQITTWGPRENIEDYANKMWSGLLRDFYKARWQTFVVDLIDSLTQGTPFNQTAYNEDILILETVWYSGHGNYPEHPQGNTLTTVLAIHQKYRKHAMNLFRGKYF
jgi:alpha-N-acetylglucosaminidase